MHYGLACKSSDLSFQFPHLSVVSPCTKAELVNLKQSATLAGACSFSGQSISLNTLGHLLTDWTVRTAFTPAQLQSWQGTSHLTSLTRLVMHDTSGQFFQSSQDMKELQSLNRLHTLGLMEYPNLALQAGNLTNLQPLELRDGSNDTMYNLECLTLLTALSITQIHPCCLEKSTLPSSTEARLQHLQILCITFTEREFNIYSLELALLMTSLHLDEAFPDNLKDGGWPQAMPCLAQLTLCDSPLPAEMLMYTSLQQLDVSDTDWVTLPDWVSALTQLQGLLMHEGKFDPFPEAEFKLVTADRC